jgi:Flp pilus assembly protein TadG
MRVQGRRRLNRSGATLVVAAVMIFLFLGMSALAIDYGMIKSTIAEAQRAMDASALAGASAFLINDPTIDKTTVAYDRAKDLAQRHTVHRVTIDTLGPCGTAEVCVTVDLANEEVTSTFTRANVGLWFAKMFGSNTMGIKASATAHAILSGISTCLMPVAVPDKWQNHSPDLEEDANNDGILDYNDRNTNGQWDWSNNKNQNEAWEQWAFDPSEGDVYYPPNSVSPTGYSSYDYGKQMVMMQLDPASTNVASNYLAWGKDGDAASDSALAARIRDPECSEVQLGANYQRAANGSKPNLSQAWEDRINRDPSADWTWDNSSNAPVCGAAACPANWEDISPRVVAIALYDPEILTRPNDNTLQFVNFAKVFLDKRPCSGPPGQCKAEVTARFLGYVNGLGSPGVEEGPLVKHLVLIK